jgi:AcrR family transcriptional regulator
VAARRSSPAAPPSLTHRERLIAAMAASIEEKGYRETTVADVVRIAHTSRRTFYQHFEDRDACFLALFDAVNDATMERIASAVIPDQPMEEQVDRALEAYIDSVTSHPALYQSFVRELPGLGRAGADRGIAVVERFARLLIDLVESGRAAQPELQARPLSMDAAVMIVGGLRELAVISLQHGRDLHAIPARAGAMVKAMLSGELL